MSNNATGQQRYRKTSARPITPHPTQAFILYEDELTDSKAQVRALVSMAGTLLSCEGFDHADYDSLATKTAQYAAKLLKKPDQCRMVTLCSHLFWAPDEVGVQSGLSVRF